MAEINIGLKVDYKEALDNMTKEFNAALQEISGNVKKGKFQQSMEEQIKAVEGKISGLSDEFKAEFAIINNQKIDASNFEKYQQDVEKSFNKMRKDISGLTKDINGLRKDLGMLDGSEFGTGIKQRFDDLFETVRKGYAGIKKTLDFTDSSSIVDTDIIKKADVYKRALKEIEKIKSGAELPDVDTSKVKEAVAVYKNAYKVYNDLSKEEYDLSNKLKSATGDEQLETEKELFIVRQKIATQLEVLQGLYTNIGKDNLKGFADPSVYASHTDKIEQYVKDCTEFIQQNEKMVASYKETQTQLDAAVTEFKLKNGAIHIPIEIEKLDANAKRHLFEEINKLQNELDKKSVIAKVKLTLDSGSSRGYKKNGDIEKQLESGQGEPSVDISKAVKNTYIQAVREAEETAKNTIKAIQTIFEGNPIKITPNKEAFIKELESMIEDSFKAIASDTTGLNVNKNLEKLVENLKEVSKSLSGNDGFKFGLDEESISRITKAIENMANMIKRAFNVASDSDIENQWVVIEGKFKSVADELGHIDARSNKNKETMRELAAEYKKFIDMGGTKGLSELPSDTATVERLIGYYEELSKAVQETTKQQEKQAKQKSTSKTSTEDKDAIKAVTGENKKLETQAENTSSALDKEGKAAQSASEKFRKLAKEKGAAVYANRELAKAAKETADALEREAKARKSGAGKTNGDAIDSSIYNSNYLKWQSDIEKSLKDSGDYAGVYEAKISQATNGTVKFTAVVKTLDGALKKFSANVNDTGGIFAPSVSGMKEGQVANFEMDLVKAERIRDAIADMFAEGGENKKPIRLDRTELQLYSDEIQRILKELEEVSGTSYKLDITSGGRLSIVRSEIAKSGAEAEQFAIFIDRIDDIFEETADGIVVSSSKIEAALESAFDGAKISNSFKGVDPTSLNQGELWRYLSAIEKAAHELENADTKYMVSLGKDGTVNITKEIQKANGEIKIFKGEFKDLNDLIDVATGAVKDLGKALKDGFDSGKVTTKTRNIVQEAQDAIDLFEKSSESKSGFKYISNDVENLKQKIKEIKNLDGLQEFNDDLEKLRERLKLLNSADNFLDKIVLKHQGNSNWGKVVNDINRVRQTIAGIDSQNKLNEFKQSLTDIITKLGNIGKDNKLGNILGGNRTFKDIDEVRTNIDSLFASMGKVDEKSIKITGLDKLTVNIKLANGEIRKMAVSLDSNKFARFVDKGIVEFGRLGSAVESVFKGIQGIVRIYLSPQDFIRYFRQGFDAVREVNVALTELRKVSDSTTSQLASYFDNAVESAQNLGSSVSDMISATADWSRLGYNLPDSRKLGEVAVLYKNVGDGIDINTANESLVSTLQGFQLNAEDALSIIDSFNEVSNNYAISSAGIGEALKRSAAAFNAANTDLNQSIALITAGNEIVQSPEKVGTMWQTVSARIRGTKSELEELGETTDDVLSTSKLRELVLAYTDVDIMKDKDTYKDIYTIVSEIGEKWKELKDVERAALLEALAGKKQSNTLAAVLNNAERLENIYQTAEKSAGSAMREQEKYSESIQYSIDQLTAYGEDFWTSFINTEDVKNVIDFLNVIIKKATKIVDICGSLPSVLGIAGSLFLGKHGLDLVRYDSKNGNWGSVFSTSKAGLQASNFLNNNFSVGMAKTTTDASGLLGAYGITGDTNLENFINEIKNGNIQLQKGQSVLDAYNKYLKTVDKSSKMAAVGTKALSATMKVLSSLGWMALITAITWGVQKAIDAIGNYVNRAEISRKNLEEISSELESTTSELDNINKKIGEIQAKGKLSLTDKVELQNLQKQKSVLEDQVRLLELKKELAAEKSNKDAVSTANSDFKGYRITWTGAVSDKSEMFRILGGEGQGLKGEQAQNGQLQNNLKKLAEIESKIESEADQKKKVKLYEKKANIQGNINTNKQDLSNIYLNNLELIEQITGDDPASKAAREKLEAQNEIIEKYIFTAEEIAQKNLQKFKSKFANYYNEQLDLIQDDASHVNSKDVVDTKSGENFGIDKTGVTEAGLNGLVNKAKELNQAFADGKITALDYFDNLSAEIEKINLDDVGTKLNGGNGDNDKTDYIEQTIATLSAQLSDAMLYADAQYKAGEISVGDYVDTLNSGINTQKKLLKSTYKLTEGEDGLVEITKDMDESTRKAAESFNGLVETQKNLSELDKFADSFGGLVDKMLEAGYIENNNITEKLLGDPALFSQTVDSLSNEMRRLASVSEEEAQRIAGELSGSFGKSKDEIYNALVGNKGNLENLVGQNINAVNAMENVAAKNASGTIKNASQAIGKVLKALGDAISKFEYKLEATPYLKGNTNIIDRDEDGKIRVNSPATFGWTFKGTGGDSFKGISTALQSAGEYFDNSSEPLEIIDWGSFKNDNKNDNGDAPPDIKDKGNSGKKPFDDTYYSTIDAWLEENEKEIEKFEKEREALNRKFENALEIGDKEQAEILRRKLSDNTKTQKDILHRQNEAHRITKSELLTELYKIAPELNGKAWEDISEVDLTKIENQLSNAAEMSSGNTDKQNQAKLTSNRFKGIVEDLKKVDEAIKSNSEAWLEEGEKSKGYWESLIDFQDSYSNEWIETQKAYDNLTEQEELAAYGRMINNYKEFQRQILQDMSLTEDEKLALIKKSNDLIDDYSEKHYQLQKDASWNESNNWISDRNTYNDWALFNDSEVEAWERVLVRIRKEYPKDLDKIREAEKNLFEARKKELDKANDFANSYLDSQKTILQAKFDVENAIAEARHEINKELETSMTMYGYLEEDTRKLLFNQEDYNTLVKELNGIESEVSRVQSDYDRALKNSTLETVESITSEYQMQYETLMKSYEVAKADLEIAKKKQKLNNVLNDRNVRMFINGQWQWVANTEDVANAKSELADAEYAKKVEQAGLTQQNSINELTKKQDALGVTIKQFDNGVIDLKDAVKDATDAIGEMPFALSAAYSKLGSSSSSSSGGGLSSGGTKSNATATIPGLGVVGVTVDSNGKTVNSGLPVGTVVHTSGGDFQITGGSGGNYTSVPYVKEEHAGGTRYTPGGLTLMGEDGFEAYVGANGRLIPIAQPTIGNIPSGGIVFNSEQLRGLRTLWDMSNLKLSANKDYIGSAQPQQVDQSQDNRIIINGMTVDSGSADGQALISALRRYVGNH